MPDAATTTARRTAARRHLIADVDPTKPIIYVCRPPHAPGKTWYKALRHQLRRLLPDADFLTWSDVVVVGGHHDEIWPATLARITGLAVVITPDTMKNLPARGDVGPVVAGEMRDAALAGLPVLVCHKGRVYALADCTVAGKRGSKAHITVPDGDGITEAYHDAVAKMGGRAT